MRALLARIRAILKDRRTRRFWARIISVMAGVVVFISTYALILPAITMEREAACGIEAHQHTEECYGKALTCGLEESEDHQHTEACYEQVLICGKEEHIHSVQCYKEDYAGTSVTDGTAASSVPVNQTDLQNESSDQSDLPQNSLDIDIRETQGSAGTGDISINPDGLDNPDSSDYSDSSAYSDTSALTAGENAANGTTNALPANLADEDLADGYVPALDPLDFNKLLTKETGFYYHHEDHAEQVEEGQSAHADTAAVAEWQKLKKDTVLGPDDLVRVYLAYSIPAGSLNETNQIARYRLPSSIHLTDDQILAINSTENGIAAAYADSGDGTGGASGQEQTEDKLDQDRLAQGMNPDQDQSMPETEDLYRKYLGAEAVEGTRTPDKALREGAQEYISAVVKAENVYENTLNENGNYVDAAGDIVSDQGEYIGQDLIFVFTPYTIQKNQNTYDSDGNPTRAGEKVTGWFAVDLNMDQIDWIEAENEAGAEVVFVQADAKAGIKEKSETLRMKEQDRSQEKDEKGVFKEGTLTAEGDGYHITLDYTAEAQIPENAALSVKEITPDTDPEAYTACLQQAAEKMGAGLADSGEHAAHPANSANSSDTGSAGKGDTPILDTAASRFFDIEIVDTDEAGNTEKIEPAAPVAVNIRLSSTAKEAGTAREAAVETDNGVEASGQAEQANSAAASASTDPTQNSDPTVLHFAEEGVEEISAAVEESPASGSISGSSNSAADQVEEATAISFEAESFSIYGVVYTVDFHYEINGRVYEFSIPGGGFVSLEHLVEALGIADAAPDPYGDSIEINSTRVSQAAKEFVADVEKVEFSSPELVWVGKTDVEATVGQLKEANGLDVQYSADLTEDRIDEINAQTVEAGDWALISMQPFLSQEQLTVTMKNGDQFVVEVTDAQISTRVITADGKTFNITVTYGENAGIPDDAQLKAFEMTTEDPAFEVYCTDAGEALDRTVQPEDIRIFDIAIVAGNEEINVSEHKSIEPEAPVNVAITYKDGMECSEEDEMRVVHFADRGPEILSNRTKEDDGRVMTVSFSTDSFSPFATIRERITDTMANGCIAYFSFDNESDGFTGAGATATRRGTTVLRDGQSGTALYLNGDGYLDVTGGLNGHLLTGLDEFTVSYWCSTTESTSDGSHGNWAYYAAPNADGQTYQQEKYIGVSQTGNSIKVECYNNNGVRPGDITNENATPMNQWHHVTVVYRNNKTELYVDGVNVGEETSNVDLTNMLGYNSVFQIGRANWGSGEGYRGYIDEFSVFNYAMSPDEVSLLHENAYYQEAGKVSVSNLVDGENYIIYNEVWNPDAGLTGAYEYYAIDGNGNLVKVYDKSDQIYYRGETSLEWKLIVHSNSGQESAYYEFYNEETGKYLAPQSTQLLQDSEIGLHLNGRQDGSYASTIEAWDGGAMSYYGYRYDYDEQQSKLVLTTASESETEDHRDWEFFFAKPEVEKPVTQLEIVNTVTNPAGLTIKMFDYPTSDNQYDTGHSSYSEFQNLILSGIKGSSNSAKQWDNSQVTTGILENTLGQDNYPKSKIGKSLQPLFSNGKTVDKLFIQSIYDESGYYEYSSFENYAYLGNSDKFTVYKQVGAPSAPSNQANNPEEYYQRGNFMPYNAIRADTPEPYDGQKNYIDEFLQPLSPDDPRYGESLYRAQGNLNYHFGMNISADFIMTNGGNDDRGNPVTFEFNGDDDMWVFVDGVLLLDMGGCHHAHSGSINFETGEIVVQNLRTQNTTTIKECYRNAHVYPDGTPWPVGDDSLVDKYFHNDTYVDYGAHNLQMYYMERGGGASNLHVKFNLTIAEPGKLKISKSLKDVDPRYAKENFWYQICDAAGNPITHIGAGNDDITSIVNEKTGQAISIDSNGRFSLKAGETAVVSVRESHIHYSVREIGLNPNDYDVLINGEQTPVLNGTAATESDTVDNRPLVVFENSPKHLGSLRITKFVDSVVKVETSPKFEFYVYLEDQSGAIVPYSQGLYYVMKGNRYCEYENGELIELDEGVKPVPLKAGQYGAISQIPDGYSIFVPDLLPGTHFLVTERLDNLPDGYMFVKKELTAGTYDAATSSATYNGTAADGKIKKDTTADEVVTNRPTGAIAAEKTWNDGGFVTAHGDIYAALYKKTGTGENVTYSLVEGSVKKLEYDSTSQKYRVEYYLPDNLLSDYVIREVAVTVNQDQTITVDRMISEDGHITVSGETTLDSNGAGSGSNASDTYIVNYEDGTETEYDLPSGSTASSNEKGRIRTDQISNTLPKVSLYKINEFTGAGKQYLKDAVFSMETSSGQPVKNVSDQPITFTSDTNGMLFADRYFSDGTYYFRETTAPNGYTLLENRIVLTVQQGTITAVMENPGTTLYADQLPDNHKAFRFEVMNHPGVELPNTGGNGTDLIYRVGLLMTAIAIAGLLLRSRIRGIS